MKQKLPHITPQMLRSLPDQTSYTLNQLIDKVNNGDITTTSKKGGGGGSQITLYNETGQNTDGAMTQKATTDALSTKVTRVAGKGLSTNDYTDADKNKLSGIAAGAEVNVNADWNATSGDAQILNKPSSMKNPHSLTIKRNGSTVVGYDGSAEKTADIAVPTKTSDLTNDSNFQNDTQVATSISSHNSSTSAHSDIRGDISGIEDKIPSQATSTNQLADKDFVNSSINSVTAYYITKDAAGTQFDTKHELDTTTVFYSGGEVRIPTRNDYCIVAEDETAGNASTRYIYQNGQWEFQYIINETAFTAAQLAAINSGITSTGVTKLNGIEDGAQKNDPNTVVDADYVHTDNNYTTTEKTKLSNIEDGAQKNAEGTVIDSSYVHTDNNYTDTEKTKLSGIEDGAQKNLDNTVVDANYVHTDNNYTDDDKTKLDGIDLSTKLDKVTTTTTTAQLYGKMANGTQNMFGVTNANISNTVVGRNVNGNFSAADPVADDNVATKKYVDDGLDGKASTSDLDGKVDKVTTTTDYPQAYQKRTDGTQGLVSFTPDYSTWTLAQRDGSGRIAVGTPSGNLHATTKKYVDDADANKLDKLTTGTGTRVYAHTNASQQDYLLTTNATANSTVYRDGNANISVGTPTLDAHATTKKYVDDNLSDKTDTSVLPNNGNEMTTKFRMKQTANAGTTTRYYKIVTFPVSSGSTYGHAILRGRIGGFVSNNFGYIEMVLGARGGAGITCNFIGANDVTSISSVTNKADVLLLKNTDNTHSLFIAAKDYFVFDLSIETLNASSLDYDGTYTTEYPSGTLVDKFSSMAKKTEFYNGKLYAGGKELATTEKNVKYLDDGTSVSAQPWVTPDMMTSVMSKPAWDNWYYTKQSTQSGVINITSQKGNQYNLYYGGYLAQPDLLTGAFAGDITRSSNARVMYKLYNSSTLSNNYLGISGIKSGSVIYSRCHGFINGTAINANYNYTSEGPSTISGKQFYYASCTPQIGQYDIVTVNYTLNRIYGGKWSIQGDVLATNSIGSGGTTGFSFHLWCEAPDNDTIPLIYMRGTGNGVTSPVLNIEILEN